MSDMHFEDDYDYIVCGTGLTQCILASILASHGKSVLHIDRNSYYGDECASLSLEQLFEKFRNSKPPNELGRNRDYNIDMVPKMPMSNGNIMKAIIHTKTTRYLEFQKCKGAFVLKKGKLYKVPSTDKETLTTGLMGFFDKKRLRDLILFIMNINVDNPQTYEKVIDVKKETMRAVFKKFGLDAEPCEFIGHAMALYHNEEYLDQSAYPALQRIKLFLESISMYGDSPYIYPKYGIGELCQAFARLSAVFGAAYILGEPVDELLYGENGNVKGIRSKEERPRATHVVGDPTYFPNLVKKTGQIVRCVAILNHPIKNTDNADSGMIIIPQGQVKRQNDIYISFLSSLHCVCPQGRYLAFLSTAVETKNPEKPENLSKIHQELAPAIQLLEPIDPSLLFYRVSDIFEPLNSGEKNVHIARSIDATSDFESVMNDVFRLYRECSGEDLDLSKEAEAQEKTRRAAGCPVDADGNIIEGTDASGAAVPPAGSKAPAPPPSVTEGATASSSDPEPVEDSELTQLLTKVNLTEEESTKLEALGKKGSEEPAKEGSEEPK